MDCSGEESEFTFQGVHMLAGHLASKFITEQNFNANNPEDLWHFTTTKTIIECLRKNKEEFGRWLEEEKGIRLIVLGVDTEYYHNNFPIEEAYDFILLW
jgi:hypothetical protein